MPRSAPRRARPAATAIMISMSFAAPAFVPGGAEAAGTHKEAMQPVIAAGQAGAQAGQAGQQESGPQGGGARHAAALPGRRASGLAEAPSCLPDRLLATLRRIEQRWGPVEIISAHRPGATIRGSGRASLHASCRAVDFRPPKGSYRAVAAWLKKSHAGGVGTYSGRHDHIHIDARRCAPAKCYRWHN